MRKGLTAGLTVVLMGVAGGASAADFGLRKSIMPERSSGWELEVGTRMFFSSGELRKDLAAPGNAAQLNSRLTYAGASAYSPEVFGRIDTPIGLFIKGYAGIGWHSGGTLRDEDFPPDTDPYSSTNSAMRDGKLSYSAADLGYTFWRGPTYRFGGFVGYSYVNEKFNGFGCVQTATSDICEIPTPASTIVLSETGRWTGVRVGLGGDVMLSDRVTLSAEGAYMPYVSLDATDNHWLRPDINPMSEKGHGHGFQLEATLSYQVTDAFSVGVGGRYWMMQTNKAETTFPGVPLASPMKFRSERWGGFVQAAYKFGAPPMLSSY